MGKGKNKKKQAKAVQSSVVPPPTKSARLLRVSPIISWSIAAVSLLFAGLTFYFNWSNWQKPDLTLSLRARTIEVLPGGNKSVQFEFGAENRASTTAAQFYWHLNIPESEVVSAEMQAGNQTVKPGKYIINETRVLHFEGNVKEPLHNGGRIFAFLTMVMRPDQSVDSRWQVSCCGNMIFPAEAPISDRFGILRVDPSTLQRWETISSTLPVDLLVRP